MPADWMIGVSQNGWTTDPIGLDWLKKLFDPYTKGRTIGTYRLLIMDGHGSHVTGDFDKYCTDNLIIVLCMPPHSSHLLQPLDVSCFSVLKRSYGSIVQELMRTGINHVDKDDFLELYLKARAMTYNQTTIQSGFRATGLVPFDPDEVLSRLHIQIQTPSPPRPIQALAP